MDTIQPVDHWHDASGPLRPEPRFAHYPTAADGVEFVRKGYIAAVHAQVREAAEAIGLDEATIRLILGEA